jgi:hypothetical protein
LKGEFTVTGSVLLEVDRSALYLVDSTKLGEDAKFKFNHGVANTGLYKLRVGGTSFDLIAENGDDIHFTTDNNDNSHAYQLTGSEVSKKVMEFNRITSVYVDKLIAYADAIKGKFDTNPGIVQFIRQEMDIKLVSVGQPAPDFTAMY